jgi:hypothetical protein
MTAKEYWPIWVEGKGISPIDPNPDTRPIFERVAVEFAEAYHLAATPQESRAELEKAKKLIYRLTREALDNDKILDDLRTAEAANQRLREALQRVVNEVSQEFCQLCSMDDDQRHKPWCAVAKAEAALRITESEGAAPPQDKENSQK